MATASSAAADDWRARPHAADRRPEVLDALRRDGGFLTAQGLHSLMTRGGVRISLTTVYRALSEAERAGRLEVIRASNGGKSYRYLSPVHEHHMRCRVCGSCVPFVSRVLEDWVEQLGPRYGFDQVRHAVVVTGVCPRCQVSG
ncbi:Fur family transcriptional regulator [Streptomyces sp. NPDC058372]|uniref:Fur family transcriptional regulator n=1 Tax=unclassified Streptomyces TaxID=2593676 RepID=UPI0036608D29